MEKLYRVGITNRYEIFSTLNEDPIEELELNEQGKTVKKKSEPSEKENKDKLQDSKGKPKLFSKGIKVKDENVKIKVKLRLGGSQGMFTQDNQNNQRNLPRKFFGSAENFYGENTRRDGKSGWFKGPSGEGRGRGIDHGRSRGIPAKCEFSGQPSFEKTDIGLDNIHQPSGSWDMCEKANANVPYIETYGKVHTEDQNEFASLEENETPAKMDNERKELTLTEWKALKGNRSKPNYNLRKAGEGEDLTRWRKMYALTKKKEDEEEEDEEYHYCNSNYPQRVGRQKHILDIKFTFGGSRAGRGGQGFNRVPRGGFIGASMNTSDTANETKSYRGPNNFFPIAGNSKDHENESNQNLGTYAECHLSNRQSTPKVDDEYDFPALK